MSSFKAPTQSISFARKLINSSNSNRLIETKEQFSPKSPALKFPNFVGGTGLAMKASVVFDRKKKPPKNRSKEISY